MLIDKYLPDFDVRDYHEAVVVAEPTRVFRVLCALDFNRSFIIRMLFAVRSYPARFLRRNKLKARQMPGQPFLEFALTIGWQVLEETPDRELVVGAVTQPWVADVQFQGMSGPDLVAFAEPGFTKIVWSMAVIPELDNRSRVVLETRVAATDDNARRKFKRYWFLFGPFIGLIRRIILRLLKRELKKRR